jgi:hypothetical protein
LNVVGQFYFKFSVGLFATSAMRPSLLVKVLIGFAVLNGGLLLFVGRGLLNPSLYPDGYNDARRMAIRDLKPLIDLGLVVPRWNDEPEAPAVVGGPGEGSPKFATQAVYTVVVIS